MNEFSCVQYEINILIRDRNYHRFYKKISFFIVIEYVNLLISKYLILFFARYFMCTVVIV